MTFQPTAVLSGYSGWLVLQRTEERQREIFEDSATIKREVDYFRENIANVTSAEDLVKDRRLLSVALGAFGLGDEIDKRAFIQRILESDTSDPKSFASKLSDVRFEEFSKAFGFGSLTNGTNVKLYSFQDDIVAKYMSRAFEEALGETDDDMRLAMNFRREIGTIATGSGVATAGWFQAMGQLPLQEVITTAFGFSDSFSQLDIDRQKELLEQKADQLYGKDTAAIFEDPEIVDDVLRRFFMFRQLESGPSASTPGYGALTMLQSAAVGGDSITNLLLSQS